MKRKKKEWDNGSHTPFMSTIIIHSNTSPVREEPVEPAAEPSHLSKIGIPSWEICGILLGCLLVLFFIWKPVLAAKKTDKTSGDEDEDEYTYLSPYEGYSDYACAYLDTVLNLSEDSPFFSLFQWDWDDSWTYSVLDPCWTDDPPQAHTGEWTEHPMDGKHPDYDEEARVSEDSFRLMDDAVLTVDERLFGLSYFEVDLFCLGRLTYPNTFLYGPLPLQYAFYYAPDPRKYELYFLNDKLIAVRYYEYTNYESVPDELLDVLKERFGPPRTEGRDFYSGEYSSGIQDYYIIDGNRPLVSVTFDTNIGDYYANYSVFLRQEYGELTLCHQITSQYYYESFLNDQDSFRQYWYESETEGGLKSYEK